MNEKENIRNLTYEGTFYNKDRSSYKDLRALKTSIIKANAIKSPLKKEDRKLLKYKSI